MLDDLKKWAQRLTRPGIDLTPDTLATHETFCMMPWVHLHVTQTGFVTPCCQAPWDQKTAFGSVNEAPIEEIWNGREIRRFRKNMLKGKPDERCKVCYQKEKNGFQSLRNVTNTDYAHKVNLVNTTQKDGSLPGVKPVYIDIRFSNVCNFKCRICGPWSSSQWHNDAV